MTAALNPTPPTVEPKPDAEPNRKAEVEEIVRDLAEAMRMPTEGDDE